MLTRGRARGALTPSPSAGSVQQPEEQWTPQVPQQTVQFRNSSTSRALSAAVSGHAGAAQRSLGLMRTNATARVNPAKKAQLVRQQSRMLKKSTPPSTAHPNRTNYYKGRRTASSEAGPPGSFGQTPPGSPGQGPCAAAGGGATAVSAGLLAGAAGAVDERDRVNQPSSTASRTASVLSDSSSEDEDAARRKRLSSGAHRTAASASFQFRDSLSFRQKAKLDHEASWADHPHDDEHGTRHGPVHVGVSCLIKTLSQVDPMTGTFLMQLGMKCMWNDRRLIDYPDQWDLPEDLWVPNVMMPNTIDVADVDLYEGCAGVTIVDRQKGLLEWHRNVLATFSCTFDLRKVSFSF